MRQIENSKYKISSFGEIINSHTNEQVKTFIDQKGYVKVNLFYGGKSLWIHTKNICQTLLPRKSSG